MVQFGGITMTSAQKIFVGTSWLFLILAGLFFLVPASTPSIVGAAWVSLGAGLVSHLALLVGIVFDVVQTPPRDVPPPPG